MLLIEEDEEGCLQPRRTPWIGRPAQPAASVPAPLHPMGSSPLHPVGPSPHFLGPLGPPSHQGPKLAPQSVFLPPHFCPRAAHTQHEPFPKGTHQQIHPPPCRDAPGTIPPIPREALTHIVVLEGMEKVASQLPVVSWSARGIANATYVVWRILQEMSRDRQ